jgi:hypothetical protein
LWPWLAVDMVNNQRVERIAFHVYRVSHLVNRLATYFAVIHFFAHFIFIGCRGRLAPPP